MLARSEAGAIVERDQRQDRCEQRDHDGPHAADRGKRGAAPPPSARNSCRARGSTKTLMARLTRMTTISGRNATSTVGVLGVAAVRNLGGIEFARDGGALACDWFVAAGRRLGACRSLRRRGAQRLRRG